MYTKKHFFYLLIMSLGFICGIIISNINLNHINENQNIIKKYINIPKNNLSLEVIDTYKIKEYNIEYIAKLKQINQSKIIPNINFILIVPINFYLEKGNIININEKIYEFKIHKILNTKIIC